MKTTKNITKLPIGKVYKINSYNKLYKYGDRLAVELTFNGYLNDNIILLEILTPKDKLINSVGLFYRMKILIVNSGIVGWIWTLYKHFNQPIEQLTS